MQRLTALTLGPVAAAVATAVAAAQNPGGAGNLVINGTLAAGGVATLDLPRRVVIAAVGNESGRTFTITGTDRRGAVQTESIVGPAAGASVTSLKDYKTVTQVATDGAGSGNISVGTGQTISSQWIPVDRYNSEDLGLTVEVGAVAPTYTVESTLDDPFTPGVGVNPVTDFYLKPYAHPTLDAKNTTQQGAITTPVTAVRLTFTALGNNASAKMTVAPGFAGGR